MEIIVTRKYFTDQSTISDIDIDGVNVGYVLEDRDRGLDAGMPLAEIQKIKVHGKTAIPTGRYRVIISMSERFGRLLPEVMGVPGYVGIRFHPGNAPNNTDGCLLPGTTKAADYVYESRRAFMRIMGIIKQKISKEKVYLTIKRNAEFVNK